MLSDYELKKLSWTTGETSKSLAWTITTSLTGMTSYLPNNCGDYLLSPVTTSINGYTPVSIVTDGSLTSTPGNPDSITLTNPIRSGTYDVLLQVKNPSGYYIPGDSRKYYATPIYFYFQVVVTDFCDSGNAIAVPQLPALSINKNYSPTTIPAFGDIVSGTIIIPLACG